MMKPFEHKKPETKQEKLEYYYENMISKDGSEKDNKSEIVNYFATYKRIDAKVVEDSIQRTKVSELIDDIKSFKKVTSQFDIPDAYKDLSSNYGVKYHGFDLTNDTLYNARDIDKSLNNLDYDLLRKVQKLID